MTEHLRVLHPAEGIQAFYDGRVEGYRYAPEPNWVDDGALSLGIASYALVAGDEALIYDTHISEPYARFIRTRLEADGVRKFTVLLSHWHLDHVAGTAAFADCEIIANRRTMQHLTEHKAAIEAGTHHGLPAIDPLILPTRLFDGADAADARQPGNPADRAQHPQRRRDSYLAAGRAHPAGRRHAGRHGHLCRRARDFDRHLEDLDRLWALDPAFILPNHGDPDIIAAGGYSKMLIRATQDYIRALQRAAHDPAMRALSLRELMAAQIEAGWIKYFEPYEEIHRSNLAATLAAARS